MQKFNISVPKKYVDGQGQEKTQWVNIGKVVIMPDGKAFGDLNATPTFSWDGSFQLFPMENRDQNQGQQGGGHQQQNQNQQQNQQQGGYNQQGQQHYN